MELDQELHLLECVAKHALFDLDEIKCRYFLSYEMQSSLKDALADYVTALQQVKEWVIEHGQ